MKNIKSSIASFIAIFVLFSCSKEEDYTNKSTMNVSKNSNVIVTAASAGFSLSAINVSNESAEKSYALSVTLSAAQTVEVRIPIVQSSGNATINDDYTVDSYITVPAFSTTGSTSIKIKNDALKEPTENFTLVVGSNVANVNMQPLSLQFSIQNYLSPNLNLKFNFNKTFTIAGGAPLTLCGIGYDMDFYLLDSSFNDTGIYDAAAAGCPELLTITPTTVPDGTYHIFYDVYGTGTPTRINNVYHDPFTIPISVDYSRDGGIAAGNFVQESLFAVTSTRAPGYQNPNTNYVCTIIKTAGVYTIKNSLSETIASGRMQNIFSLVKNTIDNARLKAK